MLGFFILICCLISNKFEEKSTTKIEHWSIHLYAFGIHFFSSLHKIHNYHCQRGFTEEGVEEVSPHIKGLKVIYQLVGN